MGVRPDLRSETRAYNSVSPRSSKVASFAENCPMTARDRIRLGQKVTGVALLVREASAPAALFGLCLLVFVSMEPTRRAIDPSWAVALPVVAFIAFRTAAVCLGALAWAVFPPVHRRLLAPSARRGD